MDFETWKGTWQINYCNGSTGLTQNNLLDITEVNGVKYINRGSTHWATGCGFDGTTLWGTNCQGQEFSVHRTVVGGSPELVCSVEGGGSAAAASAKSTSPAAKKSPASKAKSSNAKYKPPCAGPDGGSWTAVAGGG